MTYPFNSVINIYIIFVLFLFKRNSNIMLFPVKDSVDHFLLISLDFHYYCLVVRRIFLEE